MSLPGENKPALTIVTVTAEQRAAAARWITWHAPTDRDAALLLEALELEAVA